MCIQRNKVCFLTDAERKHTCGQEVVASHVKPFFCWGRDETEAEGILSAGEGVAQKPGLKPTREKKKERFVKQTSKDRDWWCEDKELNLSCHHHVRKCVWSIWHIHQHQPFIGLKGIAEYRPKRSDLKLDRSWILPLLNFFAAAWKPVAFSKCLFTRPRKTLTCFVAHYIFGFIWTDFERVK